MSRCSIVIDRDEKRRHAMGRLLSSQDYVIPVSSIEEVAVRWPQDAWIFAACDGDNLRHTADYLRMAERYYPVIAYGSAPSGGLIEQLIAGGCVGYIDFPADRETVARTVAALRPVADRMMAHRGRQVEALRNLRRLSPRETEVVKAICRGRSNKAVANALGISPRTVEIHRAKAMMKLNAASTVDLVRLVIAAEDCEDTAMPLEPREYARAA